VKEALMCDLPIVATPAGDIPELLSGVAASRVCRPDAEELADALKQILESKSRSNGRSVRADLSLDAAASRLLEVYERVGGIRRPGSGIPREAGSGR
jgi:glycosyltransferase involved in cell wall biosynthesis